MPYILWYDVPLYHPFFSMFFHLPESRVYIIAEAGVNHDGSVEKARILVDIAAGAEADAVKFQLFNADEIASDQAPLAVYQERSGEESQRAMLKRLTLSLDDYRQLKAYAESKGLAFITTPFDAVSAQFLAGLGVQVIKIPSGEITNLPFLHKVAALKIFTIISTGMSTLEEVADAIVPFTDEKVPFALLHCVSSYPAPVKQVHLRAMETMRRQFGVPVGYSDHTLGIEVPLAAAALGARIIEKHFTVHKNDLGPDHAASLEPAELQAMVRSIRIMEEALGTGEKRCQPCEMNTRAVARRSLVLRGGLRAGERITPDILRIMRPGTGLPPREFDQVLGRRMKCDTADGTPLTADLLA